MGGGRNRNNKKIVSGFQEGWTADPFLFSYLPLPPSEEVLAICLGLAHVDVCVFEGGQVGEPDVVRKVARPPIRPVWNESEGKEMTGSSPNLWMYLVGQDQGAVASPSSNLGSINAKT